MSRSLAQTFSNSTVVVCLGASHTEAKGGGSYNWIGDLQARPQNASVRFVNRGVGGDLAYNVLKRLSTVIQLHPDKVVVLIGANDVVTTIFQDARRFHGTWKRLPQTPSPEWYEDNLRQIVRRRIPHSTSPLSWKKSGEGTGSEEKGVIMSALVDFLRLVCGILASALFIFLVVNALLAERRPAGERSGPGVGLLHSPFYYALTLIFDCAVGILLWIRMPGTPWASWIAVLGALMILPGMAFALWGKLALGENYFISTNFGAQTLAGQRLITNGPYAIVRHPIYLGVLVATIGSLPLYQTWTTLFLILCGLIIVRRALAEEKVLAKTFGAEWTEYRSRVPMIFPRLFSPPRKGEGKGEAQSRGSPSG